MRDVDLKGKTGRGIHKTNYVESIHDEVYEFLDGLDVALAPKERLAQGIERLYTIEQMHKDGWEALSHEGRRQIRMDVSKFVPVEWRKEFRSFCRELSRGIRI